MKRKFYRYYIMWYVFRKSSCIEITEFTFQGVVFPAQHNMWSHWSPPLERSMLVSYSYAGNQVGNILALPLSGVLCDTIGWESIFFFFGKNNRNCYTCLSLSYIRINYYFFFFFCTYESMIWKKLYTSINFVITLSHFLYFNFKSQKHTKNGNIPCSFYKCNTLT